MGVRCSFARLTRWLRDSACNGSRGDAGSTKVVRKGCNRTRGRGRSMGLDWRKRSTLRAFNIRTDQRLVSVRRTVAPGCPLFLCSSATMLWIVTCSDSLAWIGRRCTTVGPSCSMAIFNRPPTGISKSLVSLGSGGKRFFCRICGQRSQTAADSNMFLNAVIMTTIRLALVMSSRNPGVPRPVG